MARGKSKPGVKKSARQAPGGRAMRAAMTPEERKASAQAAANARWAPIRETPEFQQRLIERYEALKAKLPPSALEQRA